MHTHLVVSQSCHHSGCTLLYLVRGIDHACIINPRNSRQSSISITQTLQAILCFPVSLLKHLLVIPLQYKHSHLTQSTPLITQPQPPQSLTTSSIHSFFPPNLLINSSSPLSRSPPLRSLMLLTLNLRHGFCSGNPRTYSLIAELRFPCILTPDDFFFMPNIPATSIVLLLLLSLFSTRRFCRSGRQASISIMERLARRARMPVVLEGR